MGTLRELCLSSSRLSEIDYAAFRKEIGAVEIYNMEGYFLALKKKGIKVTNDQNSTIAYLIGITDEKPTGLPKYIGGTSPDIDIDFDKDKRDEVVSYIKNKYGPSHVARIGTFNRMYAKSAIRYVGKALGYEFDFIDKLANMVPDPVQGTNWTIDSLLSLNEDFKTIYEKDSNAKRVIDLARKMEGLISSRSTHAAGIIISNEPLYETIPIWESEGEIITECDMNEVEALGFLKVDMLALKTLSVIEKTLKLIEKNHGIKLSLEDIPINDSESYELISSGNLLGIFQFEGDSITKFIKQFKPKQFSDIVLISAGFRPGPMDFLFSILKIRNNQKPDIIPQAERFPVLKSVLQSTYGYFIYQEQIQKTVQLIAGYSDQEADEFRKIVAKKQKAKMVKEKERFRDKAMQIGMTEEEIDQLWNEMESFSAYAFNLSHAVSYSIITAKTAYLKAHYTDEFYAANLIFESNDLQKMTEFIYEARNFGIEVYPPDVNESETEFTVVGHNRIRFGLSGIKGLGSDAQVLLEQRQKGGPFKSLSDLIIRTGIKTNSLTALAKAGCLERFLTRAQLLHVENDLSFIEYLSEAVHLLREKDYLFRIPKHDEILDVPLEFDYPIEKRLDFEYEVTNMWFTSTLGDVYRKEIEEFLSDKDKRYLCTVGFIVSHKKFKNGRGLTLLFRSIYQQDPITLFVFNNVYEKLKADKFKLHYYNKLIGIKYRRFKDSYAVEDLKVLSSGTRKTQFPREMIISIDQLRRDFDKVLHKVMETDSYDPLILKIRTDEGYIVARVR